LLVEELTPEGLRLNNPAGHLDPGESLAQACARETLEETAFVFTPEALVAAQKDGKVVVLDFTAEWCLTCKVNERTVLETDDVRQAMARLGVIPLKADWTKRDPEITGWLQRYGRAGVPFYVVIPKCGGDPIPLSEIITTSQVIAAMETAAAPCGPTSVPAAGAR
jgi:thiol:disulfide interchange protein DsbD